MNLIRSQQKTKVTKN